MAGRIDRARDPQCPRAAIRERAEQPGVGALLAGVIVLSVSGTVAGWRWRKSSPASLDELRSLLAEHPAGWHWLTGPVWLRLWVTRPHKRCAAA